MTNKVRKDCYGLERLKLGVFLGVKAVSWARFNRFQLESVSPAKFFYLLGIDSPVEA